MERVRAGCPDAAKEVCSRYGGHIRIIVRRRLHQRMRRCYDSIDFLQDVWASFFSGPLGQYDFNDPQLLVKYLSDLAVHKVTDEYRRNFAGRSTTSATNGGSRPGAAKIGSPWNRRCAARRPARWRSPTNNGNGSWRASRTAFGSFWRCSVSGTAHAEIAERTACTESDSASVQQMAQRWEAS